MIKKNWKKILIILIVIIVSMSVGAYAAYLLNATEVSYDKNGTTVTVKAALDELYTKANHDSSATFTQGQLVTYKGEQFYSLTAVSSTDKTMEIFCKTNINPSTCSAQANAAYSTTACAFSGPNYWRSLFESGKRLDLNIVAGYPSDGAIGKAKSYATNKGALSGRLLTYDEAETLIIAGKTDMVYGKGNTTQSFELYWLGSADENYGFVVWGVYGEDSSASGRGYGDDHRFGVRPVLRVYKSDVQNAS